MSKGQINSYSEGACVKVSKFLSLVLRHKPDTIGITLDEHGWTDVEELMKKSKEHGVNFDLDMLDFVVKTNNKKRFAFNDSKTKIRASQGHSVDVDLCLQQQVPPEFLFHGTSIDSVNSIMSTGLNKGKRNHVHLSKDVDTALKVGMRHGKPVVFRVLAANMVATGKYVFYLSENGVWLTNNVPPEFLELKEIPTK